MMSERTQRSTAKSKVKLLKPASALRARAAVEVLGAIKPTLAIRRRLHGQLFANRAAAGAAREYIHDAGMWECENSERPRARGMCASR